MSKPRTQLNRSSVVTSRDMTGAASGGGPPGDALAERQAHAAHLRPVEAVGGRQRERLAVAVEEIEGADLHAHRHGRPVHDGAHELVPVAGVGRELGELVEEGEPVDLLEVGVVNRRGCGCAASRSPSRTIGAAAWSPSQGTRRPEGGEWS